MTDRSTRAITPFAVLVSVEAQRERAALPGSADGRISGQIVTAGSPPQPVGRAVVALTGGTIERSVTSDDNGHFVFEALPSGQKMMLRVGPAHQQQLRAKLIEVRSQLAKPVASR